MKPLAKAGLVLLVLGLLGFTAIGAHRRQLRKQNDAGLLRVTRETTDEQRIGELAPLFLCTVAVVAGTGMLLLSQRVR